MSLRRTGESEVGKHSGYQCDACKTTGSLPGTLEGRKYQGHPLVLCVDPVQCRLRAQNKGIYKP